MSDLISRQELYHEMTVKSMELFEKGLAWHEFRRGFDFAMEFVQEAPSAEPERKTGRWLYKPNEYDDDTYECSQCGEPWTLIDGTPKENNMNYCPNCGAEMRGGDED